MQFVSESDKMYIVLNQAMFNEYLSMANESSNYILKKYIGMFESEGEHYILDVSHTEFCLILIQIKRINRRSPLVERLKVLGMNQDPMFPDNLEKVTRDTYAIERSCH